jgi:hypothetical protein
MPFAQPTLNLAYMYRSQVNTQAASYTLFLTDAGKIIEMSVSTTNTLTIPPFAAVAFPVGTMLEVVSVGTGQTTLVAGAGVTLLTAQGLALRAQYSVAQLYCRAQDIWVVNGDTGTAAFTSQSARVSTAEGSTLTAYGDLATAGPSVTGVFTAGQLIWVTVSATLTSNNACNQHMSFAVSGVETLAASDANSIVAALNATGHSLIHTLTRATLYTVGVSGSHTFTAKYYDWASGAFDTFAERTISISSG